MGKRQMLPGDTDNWLLNTHTLSLISCCLFSHSSPINPCTALINQWFYPHTRRHLFFYSLTIRFATDTDISFPVVQGAASVCFSQRPFVPDFAYLQFRDVGPPAKAKPIGKMGSHKLEGCSPIDKEAHHTPMFDWGF